MEETTANKSRHKLLKSFIPIAICLLLLFAAAANINRILGISNENVIGEYSVGELIEIKKDVAFLNAQGFENPEVERTGNSEHPLRYVFHFSETASYFTVTWEPDGAVKVEITENEKTDELLYDGSDLYVNGKLIQSAPVEEFEGDI